MQLAVANLTRNSVTCNIPILQEQTTTSGGNAGYKRTKKTVQCKTVGLKIVKCCGDLLFLLVITAR